MKIALVGASGFVGTAVLNEAVNRGHEVTALARKPENIKSGNARQADVNNVPELADTLKGHDAVINTFNAGWGNPNLYNDFLQGSKNIEQAVEESGVKRYLTVGGAGSLYIAPGVQLVDTPEFPEEYKAGAQSARDYLNVLKENNNLDWTFLSPAIYMHPGTSGERKGTYRTGLEEPVFDANKESKISVEDLAVAIVDEIEKGKHIRQRFTVAY